MLVSMLLRVLNLKGIISHKYLLPFYVLPKIKSFIQRIWVVIIVMGFRTFIM